MLKFKTKLRFSNLYNWRKKQLLKIDDTCRTYNVGGYDLEVPAGFNLERNQNNFPLYDRFLPILTSYISPSTTIVDIGANFGDTAFSMLSSTEASIIAIEGSSYYFDFLKRNFEKISSEKKDKYSLINTLIGTGKLEGFLVEDGSTAQLKVSNGKNSVSGLPLDSVLKDNSNIISFIKVDTDGFDYDVLLSGSDVISQFKPILFWENEIHEEYQLNGYNKLLDFLIKNDYKYFYLFDNFGNFMFETTSLETLKSLNSYLYNQSAKFNHNTIYYVDILCSNEKDFEILKKSVEKFKSVYNLN